MSLGSDAFAELTDLAQKINSDHWVLHGENIPQLNAILAALWIEIKKNQEGYRTGF
jgi:hypothetical protein